MIFTVRYPLAPDEWAKSMPSFISSRLRFPAPARSPYLSPPKYTASAPYMTAIFSFSRFPAGASSSILFMLRPPYTADGYTITYRHYCGIQPLMLCYVFQKFSHPFYYCNLSPLYKAVAGHHTPEKYIIAHNDAARSYVLQNIFKHFTVM